jgi:hypothetical protein
LFQARVICSVASSVLPLLRGERGLEAAFQTLARGNEVTGTAGNVFAYLDDARTFAAFECVWRCEMR